MPDPVQPKTIGMLEPEYHEAFQAWKAAPGPGTNSAMLKHLSPVLSSALRTYVGDDENPVLKGRAQVIALDSLAGYDPNKAGLRTYMMTQLQALRRAAARSSQVIRMPERMAIEHGRLKTAEAELMDDLGRPPTTLELSRHTGLSPRRIAMVRSIKPGLMEGQVRATMAAGDEEGGTMPAVAGNQEYHPAWLEFVHGDLAPEDQFIMEHTLGMFGRKILPKGEIARKLGISPGAVSQRAARIQRRLDTRRLIGM